MNWKKVLLIVFSFILIFAYIKFKSNELTTRDNIKIIETIKSPDKKHKAVVLLDEGNATVDNSIRVAILDKDRKYIFNSDIVFFQYHISYVDVKWNSNEELDINYYNNSYSEIINNIKSFKNINILYKEL